MNYLKIEKENVLNGFGVRVVVALCVAAGTRDDLDDLYYNSKESENINNSGRGE